MRVKICGLTNVDDMLAAIEAGADMLGFNFYPASPRCLTPEACARMVAAIPDRSRVTAVGLFVNEAPKRVQAVLEACDLDLAQLHGDEPPSHLRALARRAYKGLRGAVSNEIDQFAIAGPAQPALLIDAYHPKLYGGTGQTADWTGARAYAIRYPLMLAGGLTPENVAEAIAKVRPWGVDTASGVEAAPGRKDPVRVAAFIRAAREAEITAKAWTG